MVIQLIVECGHVVTIDTRSCNFNAEIVTIILIGCCEIIVAINVFFLCDAILL